MSPDIPGDEQCRMGDCTRRATEFDGPMPLCDACSPSGDADAEDRAQNAAQKPNGDTGVARPSRKELYPAALRERDWWVAWILDGYDRKRPVAPWQSGHAYPAEWNAELDEEERPETDFATARRWVDFDLSHLGLSLPEDAQSDCLRLGLILPADRPPREERITLIDWDDVRDPDTGEIHPVARDFIDEHGGYVEVSRSGKGLHQFLIGGLRKRGKFIAPIDDEPFVGEELPQVEIYDGGRHVAMTGDQADIGGDDAVPGQDCIDEIVREYADAEQDAGHRRYDPETNEASSGDSGGDGGDVPEPETGEYEGPPLADLVERQPDDRSLAYHAAIETFYRGGGNADGYAGILNWRLEGLVAALGEADGLSKEQIKEDLAGAYLEDTEVPQGCRHETPHRIDYAYDRAAQGRGLGVPSHETLVKYGVLPPEVLTVEDEEAEPVSALPIRRLQALDREDAKRYARKHGHDWPSTDEVRRRLKNRTLQAMRNQERVILDCPTASGKSYTVATHCWSEQENVTGGAPVIQFHETREARDQAFQDSQEHGGRAIRILGRTEACSCAAGEHDPATDDEEDDPEKIVTVDDTPASVFLERLCEGKGLPFSVAHSLLREHHDQGREDLPCEEGEGNECYAIAQWHGVPRTEDGDPAADVIHCTHQFAHVPSLRKGTNMVFDERPDFGRDDLSQDRIRRAITAFLDHLGDEIRDYEHLITLSWDDDVDREWVDTVLRNEPDREWYLNDPDAHTLAPALARAIFHSKDQANGRRSATVPHEPPRLDAEASDDDGWNREWVSVVLDEDNTIRTVRSAPGMTLARSVIGLDAHPTQVLWQRNTAPSMVTDRVLDADERRAWRLFERGLTVVQVGDATRPVTTGEYFDEGGARVLLEHLREEYGDDFRTAITSAAVEDDLAGLMEAAGVDDPETMHYGEEKSRGDFGDEDVGYLEGCIDPGDGMVLDLLAEAELDAEPETAVNEEGEEYRAHGRGFTGDDADTAVAILASVREQHVAQAAGRYARNAQDSNDTATVFVRTSAVPEGFADLKVPGVEWRATEKQAKILRALRDRPTATAAELAEAANVSKEHVRKTLAKAVDGGAVERREQAGDHGADVYRALAGVKRVATGAADLTPEAVETTNDPTRGAYTWSLAILPPHITFVDGEDLRPAGPAPSAVPSDGRQSGLSDYGPS